MSDSSTRTCIYPGCERPAIPPHPLGGPPGSFCDLEEHHALSAHLERKRLAAEPQPAAAEPDHDQSQR